MDRKGKPSMLMSISLDILCSSHAGSKDNKKEKDRWETIGLFREGSINN